MNENDAFYNALIDVAAWDKENTLDRFMNSDSLFKKFFLLSNNYALLDIIVKQKAGYGQRINMYRRKIP